MLTVTLDACCNRRETIGTGYASHRPGFIPLSAPPRENR
ncbi:hypothetical protein PSYMO_13531, partial [Pseudomonas amygdali pv. mori str. 301020]